MKNTESEAIFESLNLNPQLFINEVLNSVDDLVDGAFNFYQEEASTLLKTEGTDRADELSKGVGCVRDMIQAVLDKRLGMWETYCLHHCFVVPEGFSLPKPNNSVGDGSANEDALTDPLLDAELDSLRNKLTMVEKESADLNRELQELEKQSAKSNCLAGPTNEMVQLYEQESVHETFQEMIRSASELRTKMQKLKNRTRDKAERLTLDLIHNKNAEFPALKRSKGLFNANLEDLQGFAAKITTM